MEVIDEVGEDLYTATEYSNSLVRADMKAAIDGLYILNALSL